MESPKHLKFIRGLPCLVCHNGIETEAAHVRFSCIETGKRQTGKQEKPDDRWVVPLCSRHHREQHLMPEKEFWLLVGIDPIKTARRLWGVSSDHEEGERIALTAITGD